MGQEQEKGLTVLYMANFFFLKPNMLNVKYSSFNQKLHCGSLKLKGLPLTCEEYLRNCKWATFYFYQTLIRKTFVRWSTHRSFPWQQQGVNMSNSISVKQGVDASICVEQISSQKITTQNN